jgi:hypothetical protein
MQLFVWYFFRGNLIMKKYLLTTIVVFNACSQSGNFRAFKFDFGIGYASPASPSNSTSGGVSFTFHPHYVWPMNLR